MQPIGGQTLTLLTHWASVHCSGATWPLWAASCLCCFNLVRSMKELFLIIEAEDIRGEKQREGGKTKRWKNERKRTCRNCLNHLDLFFYSFWKIFVFQERSKSKACVIRLLWQWSCPLIKASVSIPLVSQRCQLVKTLSNAYPIRLNSPSKPTILQIHEIQYIHDLEQLVWGEQQLVDAEGMGFFFRNK